jgi:hypothetical protein
VMSATIPFTRLRIEDCATKFKTLSLLMTKISTATSIALSILTLPE